MENNDIVKELCAAKEKVTGHKFDGLYETQRRAISGGLLSKKENFVIIAPTASGKTLNAEFAIYQSLKNLEKVLYLTPTSSLCSDKEIELNYLKDMGYTITAGEGWGAANVVITTFETFYKVALTNARLVDQFRLAIVDEFQILYDSTRGFNLEKALTILKKTDCRIVCLSATFEDRNEIKDWLKAELVEVPEQFRKVKLKPDTINLIGINQPKQGKAFDDWLSKNSQLYCPIIIFCATRPWTRSRAIQLASDLPSTFSKEDNEKIKQEFVEAAGREELTGLENDLLNCVQHQVAFHHSGLNKKLKELIEKKFVKKEINFMFATSGLAYGVNSPAKTVILYDLTMPVGAGKTDYVPVYTFIQMAGRAGRPQFGKEGYTFVVVKDGADKLRAEKLFQGKLERAFSQIINDDFFKKFLLELIFSGRSKTDDLIGFFEDTFYYYQSTRPGQRSIASFDFDSLLKKQIESLITNGFIIYLGAPGFKLLPLGQVTIDFLLSTYQPYKLQDFVEISKFLDKNKLSPDFDLIYELNKQFEGARLYKIPQETSQMVDDFYANRGILKPSHPEYSAYAIFNGWMENISEPQIENDFKVYSSALENVTREMYNLLVMYEKLARSKTFDLPVNWEEFKDRVRLGVRVEELPFVRIKGIKRNTVRNLYNFCRNYLGGPLYGYKGDISQVLKTCLEQKGESVLLTQMIEQKMGIGPAKAGAIIELIKQKT